MYSYFPDNQISAPQTNDSRSDLSYTPVLRQTHMMCAQAPFSEGQWQAFFPVFNAISCQTFFHFLNEVYNGGTMQH